MSDKELKTSKNMKNPDAPKTDISQEDAKSTRRFVFWMVALIALTIIAGGAILYWLVGEFVTQSNKNKSQDITIGLLEKKKKDIQELKPNYEKIIAPGENGKSDADLILSALPEDEGYDELIAMLEKMGQESGVKITTISKSGQSEEAQSPSPSSFQAAVNLEGDFAKILDFLKKTEDSSRVLDFVSMSLSGSTKSGVVTSTITFDSYYQGPASIEPTEEELK